MINIRVPFNRHFKVANATKKRYRSLKGSAGSGKSVNVAQDFILKLSDTKYKGANLLVVRKADVTSKHSTYAELTAAIYRIFGVDWEKYWSIKQTPMELKCKLTNNGVIFRGMKDEKEREKVKSINFQHGKLTWIWVEEATELQEADIDILDDRLRGQLSNKNLYYQMTFTFNPVSASHWIKKKYFDAPNEDMFTHHSTYLENRFIDDAYHRRMMLRKEQDPDGYQVYGLGNWGELGGLILSNYIVQDFDTSYERFDSMVHAQDFGFNHSNAILTVGFKDGELFVCNEIYVNEMDTNEIIQLADRQGLSKQLTMYCDSAEPDRIRMWQKAGYNAAPVHKNPGSVKAQIDILKKMRIHIHPSCMNTIKEIQQWKWKKNTQTNEYIDEPVEVFDDAMAALRYSIEPFRGLKTEPRLRFL
jgi:phage terminase large subunit